MPQTDARKKASLGKEKPFSHFSLHSKAIGLHPNRSFPPHTPTAVEKTLRLSPKVISLKSYYSGSNPSAAYLGANNHALHNGTIYKHTRTCF